MKSAPQMIGVFDRSGDMIVMYTVPLSDHDDLKVFVHSLNSNWLHRLGLNASMVVPDDRCADVLDEDKIVRHILDMFMKNPGIICVDERRW